MMCLCMSAIFAFPQAPFNPFPPGGALPTAEIPATISDINLPTGTALPTLGDLPPEQTATPAKGQPTTNRPTVSEIAPTTETPSGTQVLATPTNTPQPPLESPTATATLGGYPGEGTPGQGTPYP